MKEGLAPSLVKWRKYSRRCFCSALSLLCSICPCHSRAPGTSSCVPGSSWVCNVWDRTPTPRWRSFDAMGIELLCKPRPSRCPRCHGTCLSLCHAFCCCFQLSPLKYTGWICQAHSSEVFLLLSPSLTLH